MINVAQCRLVLLLFKGAVEYFQLCDGKDEGFVRGKSNNFRVVLARPLTSLRSRRLEVVGERGRVRGRHACLLLARTFFFCAHYFQAPATQATKNQYKNLFSLAKKNRFL